MESAILSIPVKDNDHLNLIYDAENKLHDAGIDFDIGYDTASKKREWFLDWSLSGAELRIVDNAARDLGGKGVLRRTFGGAELDVEDARMITKSSEGTKNLLSTSFNAKSFVEAFKGRAETSDMLRNKIMGK